MDKPLVKLRKKKRLILLKLEIKARTLLLILQKKNGYENTINNYIQIKLHAINF